MSIVAVQSSKCHFTNTIFPPSPEDEAGPRANGPIRAAGASLKHDAPDIRHCAVGATPRGVTSLAGQRASRARVYEVRRRCTDRVCHGATEGLGWDGRWLPAL